MELNYGNILNIIIESESLESPDWIWKARVGGDFYPGHWVCGCKLAGISGDYYNPDDIGNPLKVVALPPEEEPFYEYGGNPAAGSLLRGASFSCMPWCSGRLL
jgi:hypothetical protein